MLKLQTEVSYVCPLAHDKKTKIESFYSKRNYLQYQNLKKNHLMLDSFSDLNRLRVCTFFHTVYMPIGTHYKNFII